jgi:AcrR family transcriptional regulator
VRERHSRAEWVELYGKHRSLSRSPFRRSEHSGAPDGIAQPGPGRRPGASADGRSLWFAAPLADEEERRPPLTRQRVVAQALAVIAEEGVEALTMRTLAARLRVVPGALYRHVRNKEQLQDLVLDGVLAEVDCEVDRSLPWTEQVKLLAQRPRAVLEDHPGVAGLLKARDPLGPHSLVLAEAFLSALHAAGFGDHQAGLAYFLLVDYTVAVAVAASPTSVAARRVGDQATRQQLHEFFRTLPAERFPTLVALGEHAWLDNHDERFATGLDVLLDGLDRTRRARPGGLVPRRRAQGARREPNRGGRGVPRVNRQAGIHRRLSDGQ